MDVMFEKRQVSRRHAMRRKVQALLLRALLPEPESWLLKTLVRLDGMVSLETLFGGIDWAPEFLDPMSGLHVQLADVEPPHFEIVGQVRARGL